MWNEKIIKESSNSQYEKNRNYYEERILSFPIGVTLKLSKNVPIDVKK